MHMADALISPAVGAGMIVAAGVGIAVSGRRLAREGDERKAPLMGVLGAFVFAAQLINFSIPGTGSSGHLAGGMLLALVLGPAGAFITMASVLIVQALLFADGGLLALGANLWNLGIYPSVVGFLLFKLLAGPRPGRVRRALAIGLASLTVVELGAVSVVVETVLSGRSALPFGRFAALMLGIHFPIGLVEGAVTAAVVSFIARVRPEAMAMSFGPASAPRPLAPVLASVLAAAVLLAGVAAGVASTRPDGLEWSLSRTGQETAPKAAPPRTAALAGAGVVLAGTGLAAAAVFAVRARLARKRRGREGTDELP